MACRRLDFIQEQTVHCFINFHRSGLPTVLTLRLQARVILVCNDETEIGLFIGALGVSSSKPKLNQGFCTKTKLNQNGNRNSGTITSCFWVCATSVCDSFVASGHMLAEVQASF